ncbi:MAG: hypothetical protein D6160_19865 [Ketobacter sp.]|nr:MAG: hypothetical protein D6160_19865 [Ketobacter sp.]
MKFWFLLLVLGWRMRWLAKNNDAFKEKLDNKDIVLQFRTENGRVARYYQVRNNSVIPFGDLHPKPDMSMAFKDAGYAYKTIMNASKDKMVFMKGMGSKDIIVTGDAQEMMWFMSLIKFFPPKKKKK